MCESIYIDVHNKGDICYIQGGTALHCIALHCIALHCIALQPSGPASPLLPSHMMLTTRGPPGNTPAVDAVAFAPKNLQQPALPLQLQFRWTNGRGT